MQLNIEAKKFFPSLPIRYNIDFSLDTEGSSGPSQIFKMDLSANIKNGLKLLATFLNSFILNVWLDPKHASKVCFYRVIFSKID